jgi:hypothetical protein
MLQLGDTKRIATGTALVAALCANGHVKHFPEMEHLLVKSKPWPNETHWGTADAHKAIAGTACAIKLAAIWNYSACEMQWVTRPAPRPTEAPLAEAGAAALMAWPAEHGPKFPRQDAQQQRAPEPISGKGAFPNWLIADQP